MKKQLKFLIIDDDVEDCEFFCEAITEINDRYACFAMHRAEDALQHLKNDPHSLPDYIFLDLNMPRMNGREFLQELKRNYQLKEIPVVIYTTSSSGRDVEEARELGAKEFLTKPADFKSICREVSRIINDSSKDV